RNWTRARKTSCANGSLRICARIAAKRPQAAEGGRAASGRLLYCLAAYRADVQWPHFFAASGTGIAHCGQSLVVGAAAGAGFAVHRLTVRTSRKTANATIRKLMIAFRKIP